MTQVFYNGVRLTNVLTKLFKQEAVYDDSGAQLLFSRFTVRVEGVLHKIIDPITGIDILPGDWTDVEILEKGERLTRERLMQARGVFFMSTEDGYPPRGDVTTWLLYAHPAWYPSAPQNTIPNLDDKLTWNFAGAAIDLDNGPKPKGCHVELITGTAVMRVSFEIEVCIKECPGRGSEPPPQTGVLSNRWTVEDTIDENWYTTRTYSGLLRITQAEANVNMFRGWVIPPIQPYFKRMSIRCASSADGLQLEYTITDRETFQAAPFPATTWNATDTTITQMGGIVKRIISVTVYGHRRVDRVKLLGMLTRIIYQQIGWATNKQYLILEGSAMVASLHENKIEMQQTYRVQPKGEFGHPLEVTAGVPYGDSVRPYVDNDNKYNAAVNWTPDDNLFGTASTFGLFICHLRDGCNRDPMGMPKEAEELPRPPENSEYGKFGSADKGPATPENRTEVTISMEDGTISSKAPDVLNDALAWAEINPAQGMYTWYDIETSYASSQHRIAMPIAASAGVPQTGNPITTSFVQMAPPQVFRKVIVTAVRYGEWPRVPSFRTVTDPRDGTVLELVGDAVITPRYPPPGMDKHTRKYELVCEYSHVLDRGINGKAMIVGRSGYEALAVDANPLTVPADIFDDTMLT